MTKAFEEIAAGLHDAIAFAKGDTTRGRIVAGPGSPREDRDQADPRKGQSQSGNVLHRADNRP